MRVPQPSEIPLYLQPYVVEQNPELYTPIDHASWRFILKIARAFFARHAHAKYLDGLRETGISSERIPRIDEMDARLRKFGWRAVAVSGFIPPAVFMEYLSLGILPIACDMRKLEHLAYTPAPDIVHEAAGHAPIIADPEYAAYLRSYGEISQKAIFSRQDLDVYEAIRNLSEVKEDPQSSEALIRQAQARLDEALTSVDYVSEATWLARMSWWTIEYGLVGNFEHPKIYGAGLLSSVGESYYCLSPQVKRVPFSIDCIETTYDITKPQPQLFVAKDFSVLTRVLDELAGKMAFRIGGLEGLERAKKAETVTTAVLDSGVQVSGVLSGILTRDKEPIYLQYRGPCQLSCGEKEIAGHGAKYHAQGFGTALGKVKPFGKSPAALSSSELESLGFQAGKIGRMEFESGVTVEGVLSGERLQDSTRLILSFEDCTVRLGEKILFDPAWGTYDLACGNRVVSVFGCPADRARYLTDTGGYQQKPGAQKSNLTPENSALCELYARVRALREMKALSAPELAELERIYDELASKYPEDWLLRYELVELNSQRQLKARWAPLALVDLGRISKSSEEKATLITRGLELL